MRRFFPASIAILTLLFIALPGRAAGFTVDVSLRGSPNSMLRQNEIAKDLGYSFVEESSDLKDLIEKGVFVPLPGNDDYTIDDGVSHAFARPEVRLFVERLARQYHEGTGEKLVVTSLTRPVSEQPRNSHELSVHPAGIAVDLRVSSNGQARAWLESVLLKLERQDLLDITRERRPPHYHVAVFTEAYRIHVEDMIGVEAVAEALRFEEPEPVAKDVPRTIASLSEKTAASAIPAVQSSTPVKGLLLAAVPVVALLFFLLGYRRGNRKPVLAEDMG